MCREWVVGTENKLLKRKRKRDDGGKEYGGKGIYFLKWKIFECIWVCFFLEGALEGKCSTTDWEMFLKNGRRFYLLLNNLFYHIPRKWGKVNKKKSVL